MKTIGDQAKEFRDAMGWSTTRMASEVTKKSQGKAVSRQNIEGLEAKGNRKPHFITALAATMGATVDDLYAGRYIPRDIDSRAIFTLDKAPGSSNPSALGESSIDGHTPGHEIKRFDTGGAMGHGVVLKDQPGVIESWQVSQEWIQKNVKSFTSAKNLCVVTGFGDSMRGLFNPGDPLLVDIGVTSVDFEGVYFFRVAEEGFVKRLQRIPGQGLLVISENTKYRDWTVTKDMDFQVFGRVVKVWCGEEL